MFSFVLPVPPKLPPVVPVYPKRVDALISDSFKVFCFLDTRLLVVGPILEPTERGLPMEPIDPTERILSARVTLVFCFGERIFLALFCLWSPRGVLGAFEFATCFMFFCMKLMNLLFDETAGFEILALGLSFDRSRVLLMGRLVIIRSV